ncbi:MAG: dTDP-glucose 4,6-dehydratase [Ignavibacteriae bacterium]|nr:MAG: dTDP-glucose 4,6-dehydratase [Ignavibacteriota bacterium]
MRILVTGGAGFIGSNFIHHLIQKHPDYLIINLDKLTYAGNLENLKTIENNPNYNFIKGDICDRNLVASIIDNFKVQAIINFAAESHVDRSIMGSDVFIQTNIVGTHTLLEVAREKNIEKFIQISTDEVYGSLDSAGKFTEQTPLHPNSPYAASKASADLLALAYQHTYGVPVIITRCSNNYGPYQFPEKLIPLMIVNALNNKPLPIYGDGQNVRDWIYVTDHCEAILTVLEKGKIGEVYNIGAENEKPNIEIVKLILKELGKDESLIKFVKDRPGHDRRYAIDATKIKTELGWRPAYTFEKAIKSTIDWYLDNETWWNKIISGEYLNYYKKWYEER